MRTEIAEKCDALAALCRRYGVTRLEVFGSTARGTDYDIGSSDVDFLVTFDDKNRNNLTTFLDLKDALEQLLDRPVDLVERAAIESSRNFLRRQTILSEAQSVYG